MRHDSPLRKRHETYPQRRRPDPDAVAHRPGAARGAQTEAPQVEYVPWGPAEPDGRPRCTLVAGYGDLESEYAAIRQGAGLFDAAHRGTILVTGDDRRDFLDRMVTQKLGDLQAGVVREAFWLNRKGRINADLLLVELGDRLLVDVDVHCAEPTASSLGEFVFTEDVSIADVTGQFHHLSLHGPAAQAAVGAAAGKDLGLDHLSAAVLDIDGVEVVAARRDQTGEPGLELIVPYDGTEAVWDAILRAGETIGKGGRRVRPVGWYALNIARVEAGTPLFNIDFGPSNLPHETGLLAARVSFTKGCYLGQEIVARTEHLGRPKQIVVALRPARDLLPEAGALIYAAHGADRDDPGPSIGVVTSSTLSPMLGATPIALAMLASSHAEEGTSVRVEAEGELTEATVTARPFYQPAQHGVAPS